MTTGSGVRLHRPVRATCRSRVRHVGPVFRIVHQGTVTAHRLGPAERPLVLSYGAGCDSFWTLLMILTSPLSYFQDLRRRLTLVIFSDLGAEIPETYQHLACVAIPLMRRHGYDLTIIRPRVTARDGNVYENITDYYFAQAAIPGKVRRSCTPRFKIGPLLAACRTILGTDEYDTIICYDAAEQHRVNRLQELPPGERERLRSHLVHPPLAMGKHRNIIEEEIRRAGYLVPPKSRCFWCIYSRVSEMEWLTEVHPDLMDRAIALEEHMQRERRPFRQARGKGDITILSKPLRQIRDTHLTRKDLDRRQLRLSV